jgi:hypothetical protein
MKMVFTHTFRESGSVQRKPKVRTEENIETVQGRMEDEPQLSLRQLLQQTELSVSTCQRIVRTGTFFMFSAMMNWLMSIFNKTGLQSIQHGGNFLTIG